MNRSFTLLFFFFIVILSCSSQTSSKITLSGSLQSEILAPEADAEIGAQPYKEWLLTNTYLQLSLQSKYVNAGARFEYLDHPLPGFEADFAGYGLPFFYVTGAYKKANITLGSLYDQFGSGLIFRTYEERSLGIDNSLLGLRFIYQPIDGLNIKVLGGKQRRYFNWNDSYVWGGDMEMNLDRWIKKLDETNTYFSIGTSFVSKHEKDEDIILGTDKRLNLPVNVGAFSARIKLQKGDYSFMSEYAWKANDPSFDNAYIYKSGNALLLSGSYSKKGMSILLQAKRSDNMSFRSSRSMKGSSSFINHLPAFTLLQTYTLATIYPYATQIAAGEWAFQGEFNYTFKRNTLIGGKYGTKIRANASYIRSIDKTPVSPNPNVSIADLYKGTNGYTSSFFKFGDEIYYQDYALNIEKKIVRDFSFNFMYSHQYYNQKVIEGHSEDGIVHANIFVGEGKYQVNKKIFIRSELQYLQTKEDKGDWYAALIELSIAPYLSFSLSDSYNAGTTKTHYYSGNVVFNTNSHRLLIGYGRTREGYNCSGGICRYIPASKGFTLSYNYIF